jgi:hypothetical protein
MFCFFFTFTFTFTFTIEYIIEKQNCFFFICYFLGLHCR